MVTDIFNKCIRGLKKRVKRYTDIRAEQRTEGDTEVLGQMAPITSASSIEVNEQTLGATRYIIDYLNISHMVNKIYNDGLNDTIIEEVQQSLYEQFRLFLIILNCFTTRKYNMKDMHELMQCREENDYLPNYIEVFAESVESTLRNSIIAPLEKYKLNNSLKLQYRQYIRGAFIVAKSDFINMETARHYYPIILEALYRTHHYVKIDRVNRTVHDLLNTRAGLLSDAEGGILSLIHENYERKVEADSILSINESVYNDSIYDDLTSDLVYRGEDLIENQFVEETLDVKYRAYCLKLIMHLFCSGDYPKNALEEQSGKGVHDFRASLGGNLILISSNQKEEESDD